MSSKCYMLTIENGILDRKGKIKMCDIYQKKNLQMIVIMFPIYHVSSLSYCIACS